MPRELVISAPGKVGFREYEERALRAEEVRVRSEWSAAKHGTEMVLYKGYFHDRGPFDDELQIFRGGKLQTNVFNAGNMFAGVVTEVGSAVKDLRIGDRVYGYGGFRDTQTKRASDCARLPEKMSWKSAMCLDPATCALGALRDGNVRAGDAVAVFGLGAIGLMTVQMLKMAGASCIFAVDPVPLRGEVARSLGAHVVLDPTQCDVGRELKLATSKRGPDVCIEFSGSRQALQGAIRGVGYGGTVVCGAFPPPYEAGLDFGGEAHLNIPTLVFSRSCSQPDRDHPRWNFARVDKTCRLWLEQGVLTGDPIVEPVVEFATLETEYARVASDPAAGIKLGARHR